MLPRRIKILSISWKEFHLALNKVHVDTPYNVLMIFKPCVYFILNYEAKCGVTRTCVLVAYSGAGTFLYKEKW
jgi:hypothetical protein